MTNAKLIAQLEDVREAYEKAGLHGENGVQIMANAIAALKASEARVKELEEAVTDAVASLVAAISLLERGGKDAAWSDKVFHTMLADYKKSVERSRAVLKGGAE